MFGYRVKEDFDHAKEQRRDRFMLVAGAGLCLLIVYWLIHPFSVAVFQVYFLTSLSYGEGFYVQRKDNFGESWLWKGILLTLPLHALFLAGIVGLDKALPSLFTPVIVYIPVLTVAFVIESALFDRIVDRFRRSPVPQPS